MKKSLLVAAVIGLSACGQQSPSPKVEPQKSADFQPATPKKPEPPPENLRAAIATARPYMSDVRGNDIDPGAAALALWGADMMKWSELQEIPLGKYAMVMKDSDSQRGSRICTSGHVIEIAVDASVPGNKIYLGGMYDDAGKIYRFIAVRSTGEIVANSRAKFCGVVTGQQHYQNSVGGVAHAVHLVGMFDLAENR